MQFISQKILLIFTSLLVLLFGISNIATAETDARFDSSQKPGIISTEAPNDLTITEEDLGKSAIEDTSGDPADLLPTSDTEGLEALDKNVYADSKFVVSNGVYRIYATTASNLVVDFSNQGVNAGSLAQTAPAQYYTSQFIYIERVGSHYRLTNLSLGLVLTTSSTWNGSRIMLSPYNGTQNQQWDITLNSDGTYTFTPVCNSQLAMDIDGASGRAGTKIQVWSKNGCSAQRFRLSQWQPLTDAVLNGYRYVPEGFTTIRNMGNSNYYLDVSANSMDNCANVQIWPFTCSRAQIWDVISVGNGLYQIRNTGSDCLLDVGGFGNYNGANVIQYQRGYTINQLWYMERKRSGYIIKSAFNGKALDVSAYRMEPGTNIQVWEPNGSPAQWFQIELRELIPNDTFTLRTAVSEPKVIDVSGMSKNEGANIFIWRSLGNAAQKFRFKALGNGAYSIQNPNSGKYLAAVGNYNGANVVQQSWNGSDYQKWVAYAVKYNRTVFVNKGNGRALDVDGCRKWNGTNVQTWPLNWCAAQQFETWPSNWSFYAGASGRAMRYIEEAEKYEGWAYRWGGRSPQTSFDCSGLAMYCSNVALGTRFDLMYTNAERLYSLCQPIARWQLQPGDLIFYQGTYGSNVNYISHVAIYCGYNTAYMAGDPIGYYDMNSPRNIYGQQANQLYARIR